MDKRDDRYGCPDHPGVETRSRETCPSVHYTPEQARNYVRALTDWMKREHPNYRPGDPIPRELL
jgi:hypothetical protein